MGSRHDDLPRERWDRERFERFSRRDPEERDYYSPPARQQVMIDERVQRKGPGGRLDERERFIERDQYGPPSRRNTAFMDEPIRPEVANQALAPYRRPRPGMIRRQSSLDTFDRRPGPRYGEEYRLPAELPIPLPIRRPHSPPRGRGGEYFEEFEERFRGSDEEYRDIRVREERHGDHRSRSRMRSRSVRRRRNHSTSSESSVDEGKKHKEVGRKGRTKLPKRLANKNAIIEIGYAYEEEDNFIIVQRALDKEHIDEIIEKSKSFREDKSTTYKYEGRPTEEKKPAAAAPPHAPAPPVAAPGPPASAPPVVAKPPPPPDAAHGPPPPPPPFAAHGPPPPPPAAHGNSSSEVVKKTTTTTIVEPPAHHHHHQDLAVMVPSRRRDDDAAIRREIAALEAERRVLKMERSDRYRDGEWEIVEHDRRPKEIIRVEKDRKGRMALVRSTH